MTKTKLEIKKLWLQSHLKRADWLTERELEHRWSMLVVKAGLVGFGLVALVKFTFSV